MIYVSPVIAVEALIDLFFLYLFIKQMLRVDKEVKKEGTVSGTMNFTICMHVLLILNFRNTSFGKVSWYKARWFICRG